MALAPAATTAKSPSWMVAHLIAMARSFSAMVWRARQPLTTTELLPTGARARCRAYRPRPVEGVGTYTWNDDAWADYRHQPKWFYHDGSQWIEYHSANRTEDVGVHRTTDNRTFTEVVDRNTYDAPAGLHIACGDPWFIKWNTAGTWRCSNQISLD